MAAEIISEWNKRKENLLQHVKQNNSTQDVEQESSAYFDAIGSLQNYFFRICKNEALVSV